MGAHTSTFFSELLFIWQAFLSLYEACICLPCGLPGNEFLETRLPCPSLPKNLVYECANHENSRSSCSSSPASTVSGGHCWICCPNATPFPSKTPMSRLDPLGSPKLVCQPNSLDPTAETAWFLEDFLENPLNNSEIQNIVAEKC